MISHPDGRRLAWYRGLLAFALVAVVLASAAPIPALADVDHIDKVEHLAAFFVLAFLLDRSAPGPRINYWQWQLPVLVGYGAGIELMQKLLPYRTFDLLDLLADVLGLLLYGLVRPLINPRR